MEGLYHERKISRRSFLKVAGVSVVGAAAFGLTGCGGGGGSSSTDTVYGVITDEQLDRLGIPEVGDFSQLTNAQKETLAQIVPVCNGVWFPLDDVSSVTAPSNVPLNQVIGENNEFVVR